MANAFEKCKIKFPDDRVRKINSIRKEGNTRGSEGGKKGEKKEPSSQRENADGFLALSVSNTPFNCTSCWNASPF